MKPAESSTKKNALCNCFLSVRCCLVLTQSGDRLSIANFKVLSLFLFQVVII